MTTARRAQGRLERVAQHEHEEKEHRLPQQLLRMEVVLRPRKGMPCALSPLWSRSCRVPLACLTPRCVAGCLDINMMKPRI